MIDKARGLPYPISGNDERAGVALQFVRTPAGHNWAVQASDFQDGTVWIKDLVSHAKGKTASEFMEELLARVWQQTPAS